MNTADAAQRAAEARLDLARREICQSGLTLRCERAEPNAVGAPAWRVWLVFAVHQLVVVTSVAARSAWYARALRVVATEA